MAQRKMSLGELAEKVDLTPCKLVDTENGQGKGGEIHHSRCYMQGIGLSTG
jgi:DNA-binding Xre family transcriptional regulator